MTLSLRLCSATLVALMLGLSLPAGADATASGPVASPAATSAPVAVTAPPNADPTTAATMMPAAMPTAAATVEPTAAATAEPTVPATAIPTAASTVMPTAMPSAAVSAKPIAVSSPVATVLLTPIPSLPSVTIDEAAPAHTKIFIEQTDHALIAGAAVSLLAGSDRQQADQHSAAALVAEIVAQTPVTIDGAVMPLSQAVVLRGGSLRYEMQNGNVTFVLLARANRLPELLRALTSALRAPAFDKPHVALARTILSRVIEQQRHNPAAVGLNIFRSGFYRDSSLGSPVLGTPAELAGLGLHELREFYARSYRRGGAKIALVGDISEPARDQARALLAALPDGYSAPVPLLGWKPFPGNSIVLASADILNPVVVIGYKAPDGTSNDFAAMYVLETVFQSSLAYDSITTAADRGFGPFHIAYDYTINPASMTITVTSSGDAPMTADRTITALIDVLSTRQLDVDAINALKKLSIGRYVMQAADPELEAERLLTLSNLGLGQHAGDDLLHKIAAVTPADLQRVVRRYCNNVTLARVAPRNESAP